MSGAGSAKQEPRAFPSLSQQLFGHLREKWPRLSPRSMAYALAHAVPREHYDTKDGVADEHRAVVWAVNNWNEFLPKALQALDKFYGGGEA